MASYSIISRIFFVFLPIFCAHGINVDDKLDFGHSSAYNENLQSKKIHVVPLAVTKTKVLSDKPNENFETIGVVCTSGECNNTIKTDVLVHIETNVNLQQNGSILKEPLTNISDVPVLVGFAGSKLDSTADEVTPQSIYVSKVEDAMRNRENARSFYNTPNYRGISNIVPSRGSFMPLASRTYPSSSNSITNYFSNPTSNMNTMDNFSGVNYKDNINIVGRTNYNTNSDHLNVPYFEPAFHSHYYGESPPPQYVWYRKDSNNYNGMVFKVMKPKVQTNWHRNSPHRHVSSTVNEKCSCQNGSGQVNNGLNWYSLMRRSGSNDPGSQINDKLAPLN